MVDVVVMGIVGVVVVVMVGWEVGGGEIGIGGVVAVESAAAGERVPVGVVCPVFGGGREVLTGDCAGASATASSATSPSSAPGCGRLREHLGAVCFWRPGVWGVDLLGADEAESAWVGGSWVGQAVHVRWWRGMPSCSGLPVVKIFCWRSVDGALLRAGWVRRVILVAMTATRHDRSESRTLRRPWGGRMAFGVRGVRILQRTFASLADVDCSPGVGVRLSVPSMRSQGLWRRARDIGRGIGVGRPPARDR